MPSFMSSYCEATPRRGHATGRTHHCLHLRHGLLCECSGEGPHVVDALLLFLRVVCAERAVPGATSHDQRTSRILDRLLQRAERRLERLGERRVSAMSRAGTHLVLLLQPGHPCDFASRQKEVATA